MIVFPLYPDCPNKMLLEQKGFLFVGRWVPNKGIRTLLNAYARLNADPQEWPLIMLGDGPLREEVLRTIKEQSIEGVQLSGC